LRRALKAEKKAERKLLGVDPDADTIPEEMSADPEKSLGQNAGTGEGATSVPPELPALKSPYAIAQN
jgi:hypothetical protein